MGVNHAQGGVTGWDVRDNEADRAHVTDEVERLAFLGHLFVDGVNMLRSPADLGVNVVFDEKFG